MSNFPSRPSNVLSGSQFMASIDANDFSNRDEVITNEIIRGNFPNFLRKLIPISISENGKNLTYKVFPDYLSIGNDTDFVRVPLGGGAAQKIADAFGCMLPTSKMSNQIWKEASIQLPPQPMNNARGNDTNVFNEHNRLIQEQLKNQRPGNLISGHKKDVIISKVLIKHPDRVAIHGMHKANGKPIQDKSWAHNVAYRDYSHGIRLIDKNAVLDGKAVDLEQVLQNPETAFLISDEGAFKVSYTQEKPSQSSSQGRTSLLERISDFLNKINV